MDTLEFANLDAAGVLKLAIQSEIDTYQMYREAWEESSSEESRRLLWTLAKEERDHRRSLQDQYKQLTGKSLRMVNLQRRRRLWNTLEPDQPPLKILESAIRDEGASLRFYSELAREARDHSGRLMFEALARQEEDHVDLLRAEHQVRLKEDRVRPRSRVKRSPGR